MRFGNPQPYVTAEPVSTWCVTDLGHPRGAVDANATSRQLRERLFKNCDTSAVQVTCDKPSVIPIVQWSMIWYLLNPQLCKTMNGSW